MSFEVIIQQQSRQAQWCLCGFMIFSIILILTAPIALAIKALLSIMILTLGIYTLVSKPSRTTLIFDGSAWYIDTPSMTYATAQIHAVRNFIWCRTFEFIDADGDHYQQLIWRDQVSPDTWRRLAVFYTLKQTG